MLSFDLQTHVTSSKQVDCMSEFYKLRKPMGSMNNSCQMQKCPRITCLKKSVKKEVMGRNISEQNS